MVATGAGTNDDCAADHTWGLLIAAQRRILPLDKATRAGCGERRCRCRPTCRTNAWASSAWAP